MGMRIFGILALSLAIAACGGPNGDEANTLEEATAKARAEAADGGQIDCAVAGAAEFTRSCTVDRATGAEGLELTVRHKEGAFRRFKVLKDGRGLVAADGAEPAAITPQSERAIMVQVGPDRYILPATVKGATAKGP
jgi:hypothetical protein